MSKASLPKDQRRSSNFAIGLAGRVSDGFRTPSVARPADNPSLRQSSSEVVRNLSNRVGDVAGLFFFAHWESQAKRSGEIDYLGHASLTSRTRGRYTSTMIPS